jgi:hypothetical protein
MNDKLTIVGPEPEKPEKRGPSKRLNIEAVLLMAKYDAGFRTTLFDDREKALAETTLDFSPGEKLLLSNISDEQLTQNIREFQVPGIGKRSLSNWAKAAAVVLLLSSLSLADMSCSSPSDPGPISRGSLPDSTVVEGITPDPVRGSIPDTTPSAEGTAPEAKPSDSAPDS